MKKAKLFATTRAKLTWVVVIILLIVFYFLIAKQFTPYTNNAYVDGAVVNVSSDISGRITKIYVSNNQLVARSAPIFQVNQTVIRSPRNGYITNLQMHEGDYVKKGAPLVPLIVANHWWIQANFNENEIRHIRVGESAIVSFSMYPGKLFKARVISLTQGVRLREAPEKNDLPFVPPGNNWIKLPQQFPVQLELINLGKEFPLRVGASANVTLMPQHHWFWNGLAYFWSGVWSLGDYIF